MGSRGAAFAAASLLLMAVAGCGRTTLRADAYNDFAIEAARRGLWEEATLRWQQALKTQPNDARFLNNLGVAYESRERFDDALDAYRQAHAADPKNADYERNLRRAEHNLERASKAEGEIPVEESEPPTTEPDVTP
jgi:Flp pilus assembly protein TadD